MVDLYVLQLLSSTMRRGPTLLGRVIRSTRSTIRVDLTRIYTPLIKLIDTGQLYVFERDCTGHICLAVYQ